MDKVEKRRRFIINFVYFIIIVVLFYLFIKYAFWTVFPFLFAIFIAMILQNPSEWLSKRIHINQKVISVILALLVFVLIGCVVALLGAELVTETKSFISWMTTKIKSLPNTFGSFENQILNMIQSFPEAVRKSLTETITKFFSDLDNGFSLSSLSSSFISKPINGIWGAAKQLPSFLLATLITIIATCFISADYRKIVNFIRRQLPDRYKLLMTDSKNALFSTIFKMCKAYLLIMFITFCELWLGFTILHAAGIYKGDYIIVLSVLIAIIDILPALGTGTVMIPWAIVSLFTGKIPLAIGLGCMYGIILIVREIIEPKIVGKQIGLNPVVTLMSMYIGLKVFGAVGMFLLPITIMMIKVLQDTGKIHIWKSSKDEKQQTASAKASSSDVVIKPDEFSD